MNEIKNAMLIERHLSDLFFEIGIFLKKRSKSFQLLNDDNFTPRRDRTSNDIHLFVELKGGKYFHLRGYTRHMLDNIEEYKTSNKVFLTGYLKDKIELTGGKHIILQTWYDNNSKIIADSIFQQMSEYF